MIYLIAIIAVSLLVNFFMIKSNISKTRENKDYKKRINSVIEMQNRADEIKRNQDDEEFKISNNDTVITPNIMPIESKAKHNHSFEEPCTESCPAFNRNK